MQSDIIFNSNTSRSALPHLQACSTRHTFGEVVAGQSGLHIVPEQRQEMSSVKKCQEVSRSVKKCQEVSRSVKKCQGEKDREESRSLVSVFQNCSIVVQSLKIICVSCRQFNLWFSEPRFSVVCIAQVLQVLNLNGSRTRDVTSRRFPMIPMLSACFSMFQQGAPLAPNHLAAVPWWCRFWIFQPPHHPPPDEFPICQMCSLSIPEEQTCVALLHH